MPLMTHPDSPKPFDTITDDQADVLRARGWTEVEVAAPRTRKPAKKTAKKSATPPAATTTAGGSKPTGTEKE